MVTEEIKRKLVEIVTNYTKELKDENPKTMVYAYSKYIEALFTEVDAYLLESGIDPYEYSDPVFEAHGLVVNLFNRFLKEQLKELQ